MPLEPIEMFDGYLKIKRNGDGSARNVYFIKDSDAKNIQDEDCCPAPDRSLLLVIQSSEPQRILLHGSHQDFQILAQRILNALGMFLGSESLNEPNQPD